MGTTRKYELGHRSWAGTGSRNSRGGVNLPSQYYTFFDDAVPCKAAKQSRCVRMFLYKECKVPGTPPPPFLSLVLFVEKVTWHPSTRSPSRESCSHAQRASTTLSSSCCRLMSCHRPQSSPDSPLHVHAPAAIRL